MQEVYLTVYQKIGQLREPAAFKGWFSRILINRCRQELRGRKFESLDELPESKAPSLDGMADRVHDRMQVQAALAELAPHDRAMLTMREVLELSYQEIAESLEIPLGTVRSRLFHARQRLLGVMSRMERSTR
jgi:RNA polymerase sigma-70 factor (ECF subfamily)